MARPHLRLLCRTETPTISSTVPPIYSVRHRIPSRHDHIGWYELWVRPLLQEASVVRPDGNNRRDKIRGFPHPRTDLPVLSEIFPVTWKLFPVISFGEFVSNPLNSHLKNGYSGPESAEKCKNPLFFPC